MEIEKNKLYSKQDILEILNNILNSCNDKNYKLALQYVNLFQTIIWKDNNGKDLYYDLSSNEETLLSDLALDLDYYGFGVSKEDLSIGIKDLNFDKDRNIFLDEIQNAINILENKF